MKTRKVIVDISLKSYLLAVGIFLAVLFFQHILSILVLLFTSILIVIAVTPLINYLEAKKIPRSISSLVILFAIFSSLVILIASLISPLINQTLSFLQQLPPLIERLAPYNIDPSTFLTPQINSAPESVVKFAAGTFSGILAFFSLIVISYYILQDRRNLPKYLLSLFGKERAQIYEHAVIELESRLGSWVRGELFLMILVGTLNYVGFILIGLPSAIPLAVIAGILEIVPTVGPTVAAIPAILVALSISPTHALLALALAILVQQLENNIFVPKVMLHAVGLHPVVTIVVLSIGYSLGGPVLAILALPLILSIRVIYAHLHQPQKEEIKEEILSLG